MKHFPLAYTDMGSGTPLVLLHAFPFNRRMWEQQLPAFSRSFRLIAPDYPGFGQSPAWADPFSLEDIADAVSRLLNELGVNEKIMLLGLSIGGYVAFEFVRKCQPRLKGLVLVATHPVADTEAGKMARAETAEFVKRAGAEALAERFIPRVLGKTSLAGRPEVSHQIHDLIVANSVEGIVQACHAMANRRDSTALLPEIKLPTLILSGSEDPLKPGMPPAEMQAQIAGSQWQVVEKCGHMVNLEQPQVFNQLVLSFLEKVS